MAVRAYLRLASVCLWAGLVLGAQGAQAQADIVPIAIAGVRVDG